MMRENEVTDDLLNRVLYLYWDDYGKWYRARIKKVALSSPDLHCVQGLCSFGWMGIEVQRSVML